MSDSSTKTKKENILIELLTKIAEQENPKSYDRDLYNAGYHDAEVNLAKFILRYLNS